MKIVSAGIASLAAALAMPADAQLLAHKDLSLATALTIATTAADTCKGEGYRVSVSVAGPGVFRSACARNRTVAGRLADQDRGGVIGAVGVSGAPGGDKDEACAKAGLDKITDQLK